MTEVVVGLGLTKDATIDDVRAAIDAALSEIDCGWVDVVAVATTLRRRGHPAVGALTADTRVALTLFEPSELARVTVPDPSAAVGARAGATSVAEAAALLAARAEILLLPKQVSDGVTVALAERATPPEHEAPGA